MIVPCMVRLVILLNIFYLTNPILTNERIKYSANKSFLLVLIILLYFSTNILFRRGLAMLSSI